MAAGNRKLSDRVLYYIIIDPTRLVILYTELYNMHRDNTARGFTSIVFFLYFYLNVVHTEKFYTDIFFFRIRNAIRKVRTRPLQQQLFTPIHKYNNGFILILRLYIVSE